VSRYLLVTLAEDLPKLGTLHDVVMIAIKQVNGVQSVTDLTGISQTTLDVILLKPTERVRKEEPTIYNAIRHYHARKRQPRLNFD